MHSLPSSAPSTVSVLVVDVGSTLGEFTGESTTHVLTALPSMRSRLVTEAKHEWTVRLCARRANTSLGHKAHARFGGRRAYGLKRMGSAPMPSQRGNGGRADA